MSGVDLTPQPYHRRCHVQAVVRGWAIAAGLCLLAALAPIAVESTRPVDQSAMLAGERMIQAKAQARQSERIAEELSAQIYQREREIQAASHLTRRPDWSALLNQIAAQFQGKMMMTGVRQGAASDGEVRRGLGVIAQDVPDDSQWVILTGIAGENSDVPGLILRLESLGLFDRVVMTQTQRQTFAGGARTGFVLACRIQ